MLADMDSESQDAQALKKLGKQVLADLMAPLTISAQLEKVAGESLMLVGLAFNLWSYLGLGRLPICMNGVATFALALIPQFNADNCLLCRLEMACKRVQGW